MKLNYIEYIVSICLCFLLSPPCPQLQTGHSLQTHTMSLFHFLTCHLILCPSTHLIPPFSLYWQQCKYWQGKDSGRMEGSFFVYLFLLLVSCHASEVHTWASACSSNQQPIVKHCERLWFWSVLQVESFCWGLDCRCAFTLKAQLGLCLLCIQD